MTKTTNLIIIDASGSMESKKEAVVSGLGELLKQIKIDAVRDKKTVKTGTIVLDFSGPEDIKTLVNVKDSCKLEDTISKNYSTRGSTALYDAIGTGFNMISKREKNVFVSILTDGEENASREFVYENVKKLIEEKKAKGWVITFMGTTEDAIKTAQGMGISIGNTMAFANTSKGMKTSTLTMSNARAMYYSNTANTDNLNVSTTVDMSNLLNQAQTKTDQQLKTNNDDKDS